MSHYRTQANARRGRVVRQEVLVSLCVLMTLLACDNPFVTRTPEPPTGGTSRWVPPFSAEIVLENLRNAIADRNVENYLRCFSDSTRTGRQFRFVAETAIANTHPGVFDYWSLNQERDYFSQLRAALPPDSVRSLRLDSLQTIVFGDSAQFLRAYELNVHHRQQSTGVPGRVSGELLFRLYKDQFGEWSIYRWVDFKSGEAQTWSALKAAFAR